MSRRLQVLIPEELNARIREAAQRSRVSKGQWVRAAIEEALRRSSDRRQRVTDPVARLTSLGGPTADIERVLTEIEAERADRALGSRA